MRATGNNHLHTYHLSIRTFADGLHLSLHAEGVRQAMWSEEIALQEEAQTQKELTEALSLPHVQDFTPSTVSLISHSPGTLIPLEFFRRDHMMSYYRTVFSHLKVARQNLQYEILSELEVVSIFTLQASFIQAVQAIFPQAVVHSFEAATLEATHQEDQQVKDSLPHFYLTQLRKHTHICLFQQGALKFSCVYDTPFPEDCIYYALSVWKNLGLDHQKHPCRLFGSTPFLQRALSQFISHVETCG